MKNTLFFLLLLISPLVQAQELNATVNINAQQTGKTQLSIFNTLQRSLEDFINNKRWSDRTLPKDHRINCSFFITVTKYANNSFNATLQVQSSRPVFGSGMTTPVFNYRDTDFNFSYTEYETLEFSVNSFESDLVSTISFYVYVILGMDADTFAPDGGEDYFSTADQIASLAAQNGGSGWGAGSGNTSRYALNRQLQSPGLHDFHQVLYVYHRLGLDVMHKDLEAGKTSIVQAITLLKQVNEVRPNSILIRSFFDAKANEIAAIFKGGPAVETGKMIQDLYGMAPNYGRLWSTLQ